MDIDTFNVSLSPSGYDEKKYVIHWILQEVFGLSVRFQKSNESSTQLHVTGKRGRVILPNEFFDLAEDNWLHPSTIPTLQQDEGNFEGLTLTFKPPVFGNNSASLNPLIEFDARGVTFKMDLLGVLFILLSRYDEYSVSNYDGHGRVRAKCCLQGKYGFLNRAIGNEYIEVLWAAMAKVWPGLKRKERCFRMLPSHDIDWPVMFGTKTLENSARILVRDVVKHGKISNVINLFKKPLQYALGNYESDPFYQTSWIMDQSEQHGLKSAFYYIPEKTHSFDPDIELTHPAVEQQWRQIASRGHEIGVHPGYETWIYPDRVQSAADRIRLQMEKLGIHQETLGGRQHFLRWKTPDTARFWNDANMDYDSTLGFAECPGFRCGVCYEFPMYDLVERKQLNVRQRPLVAMECSVIDDRYLGLGLTGDAFNMFQDLKRECQKYNGDFTLLWHNTSLLSQAQKDLYASVLAC